MSGNRATYTQGSVFGHVSSLATTSAIGLFAIFVVDLVDVYFIALLGQPELAAAIGFAGVGLFLGAAITIGIAIAVSTLVAQSLGEEDEPRARRYVVHGFIYSLCWTVPVTLLMLYYAPQLLSVLGPDGETLSLAVNYFRIVGSSLPILGLGMAATSILRSVGDAKLSMWSTIFGGLVNAVIDPILIFWAGWDLTGAAIASVLARLTVAGVALYGVFHKHQLFSRPHRAELVQDLKALNGIAIPSLLTNLSGPVSAGFATAQMARFGTDAVAAASVVGRITPVAFAGLYGLSGAIGPIASQNFGAGDLHRVRQTLTSGAKFVAIYVLPITLLLYLLSPWLISVFKLTGDAAVLLDFYTNFIVISYLLFGLQLAANPLFTSLRHPGFSTLSNIMRDLLLGIPLILLLGNGFGAPGVLAGQALANSIAGVVSFAVALWMTARIERGEPVNVPWCKQRWHFHRHLAPGVQHRGH